MASIEIRTKQIILEKWDEARKGKEKGRKGKPKRENLTGQAETKKESMGSLRKLLREKPARNVEIKVYWPGRRGKFDEVTLSRKKVEGREVFIKGPAVIEQIAMLSLKKGEPESVRVNIVDRWSAEDFLKGELITEVKAETAEAEKKSIPIKEGSIISNSCYANFTLSFLRKQESI